MKPTIGRIVHFVQKDHNGALINLPAIIVAVWTETCVNLQVFTDGNNSELDRSNNPPSVKWITSASLDESDIPQIASWHWPPKS